MTLPVKSLGAGRHAADKRIGDSRVARSSFGVAFLVEPIMPSCRTVCILSLASLTASFVALGGCQSTSSSWSSKSASVANESSFNVAMAAVTEADFAQRHQFYYYPSAGVYRDCDENRWLWSEDDGATWQTSTELPSHIALGAEIPFAIFLGANDPVMEHQAIVAAYPATDTLAPATATVQGSNDFDH